MYITHAEREKVLRLVYGHHTVFTATIRQALDRFLQDAGYCDKQSPSFKAAKATRFQFWEFANFLSPIWIDTDLPFHVAESYRRLMQVVMNFALGLCRRQVPFPRASCL